MLTASIRPAGIMGEGDVQLVPPMLDLYFQKRTNWQVGSNDNLFDFTYVGNVALAMPSRLLRCSQHLGSPLCRWTVRRSTAKLS